MTPIYRQGTTLYLESVSLKTVAEHYGTPCYVYSKAQLVNQYQQFANAWGNKPHLICYAVKANATLSLLTILRDLGAGFEVVSGGELQRVLSIGADPKKIVFSGVGKRSDEIALAISADIQMITVESVEEFTRICTIAKQMEKKIGIAFRVNPDIDPKTHPHISTGKKQNKFGIDIKEIVPLYEKALQCEAIILRGIHCHLGSQLLSLAPFQQAIEKLIALVRALSLKGIVLSFINVGGGLGIDYDGHTSPPTPTDYVKMILSMTHTLSQTIIIEPGRAVIGDAGLLLTKVEYLKKTPHTQFAIVDTGMNDFMRSALYDAVHEIVPVLERVGDKVRYDIVGPVCESADYFSRNQSLYIEPDDFLAILSTGAYGVSMSSNYNARLRPPAVLVDGASHRLIKRRETLTDLLATETDL